MTNYYRQIAIALGVSLFCPAAAPAQPLWPQKIVDPHPLPDDLTLPLPCGGAMVFRPVDVPSAGGPLDDIALQMGSPDLAQGYSNYIQQAWLAAPFVGKEKGTRRYYIAKYDVTINQYKTLMRDKKEKCPAPTPQDQAPVSRVSWFDAVNFSSRMTSWLLSRHKDTLPKREESYGFLRLPTEAEWYFAAQGGMKVTPNEFSAPSWPMPEGVDHYVMAGSIAAGKPRAVGSMLPNPLGLYDMLGNVGQMMLEPYRLNRVGRLQGQAGGIIVRGGNFTFNPDDINTYLREEIPPFDPETHAPTKLNTVGFRLVISANSLGSLPETQTAEKQFTRLSSKFEETQNDPIKLLNALYERTGSPDIKTAVKQISAQLATEQRARTDASMTALRAQVEAASILGMNIWETGNTIHLLKKELKTLTILTPSQRQLVQGNLSRREKIQAGSVGGYLDLIKQIATYYDAPAAPPSMQFQMVRTSFTQRGQAHLNAFLDIAEKHAKAFSSKKSLPNEKITQDIMAIPPYNPKGSR